MALEIVQGGGAGGAAALAVRLVRPHARGKRVWRTPTKTPTKCPRPHAPT